jgi:pyrroline-5-carboxylate reductase
MKIALIGFGNMGSAIYKGLLKIYPAKDILICDNNADRINNIPRENLFTDADKALTKADVVILAVKPQQFKELADGLKVDLSQKLMISIMAGVSIVKIQKLTGTKRVIRSMPNLAASVGESLTGWVASKSAKPVDRKTAALIFTSFGAQVELKNEKMINALTALSGSGPAYFFYLCEIVQKKAERLGFSPAQAKLVAEKTMTGSAKLIALDLKDASDWRKSVTSKGGTTEKAMEYMKKHGMARVVSKAIDKANKRAEELNR